MSLAQDGPELRAASSENEIVFRVEVYASIVVQFAAMMIS